jgi:predicted CoA-binding protein
MSGRLVYSDDFMRRILVDARIIAVVGASSKPMRASNHVMAYLQSRGYRTVPVNPNEVGREINGEKVYARLADVPAPVDLVDVFRNSGAAGDVVDDVLAVKDRLGIRAIWMQLGVRNDAAASRAEAAGLAVVMDRCPRIEYPRLFGTAHRSSIATGAAQS